MFEKILVPTDGTPEMAPVIDRASEFAALNGATVHFVYAVTPSSFVSLPMETSWEGVETMLKERGETALREARERCSAERIEISLLEGPPGREIVDYAEQNSCDLIVMGTHGRGGLNRLLLGSVAERVIRSATVPVMTIRLSEDDVSEPADSVDPTELSEPREPSVSEQPLTADPSVSESIE